MDTDTDPCALSTWTERFEEYFGSNVTMKHPNIFLVVEQAKNETLSVIAGLGCYPDAV